MPMTTDDDDDNWACLASPHNPPTRATKQACSPVKSRAFARLAALSTWRGWIGGLWCSGDEKVETLRQGAEGWHEERWHAETSH